jgi:hypothetical protein
MMPGMAQYLFGVLLVGGNKAATGEALAVENRAQPTS